MYVMQAAAQTGVAQEAIPGASAKLSLLSLFMSADLVVQAVMVGLLLASIWVWAIVVDKFLLYRRTKRAMDQFEQTFWSGHSLEELYRTQSARPAHSMGALFVAAMREWKRSFESSAWRFTRTRGGSPRTGRGTMSISRFSRIRSAICSA